MATTLRGVVPDGPLPPQMRWVGQMTDVLDTKFKIPGTNVRFGADFLLGLIPGVGDAASLGFSGVLIATMARHGASPRLVARMLVNVGLDALFGSIPVIGNLFDLFYRANSRNLRLMNQYYTEGRHRGSVVPVIATAVGVIAMFGAAMLAIGYFIVQWLSSWFAG